MCAARTTLKSQDLLIALKMVTLETRPAWTQAQMAKALSISPGELTFARERLKTHHLINEDKRSVRPASLLEFLVHGLKYVFPAVRGTLARGMPTGFGAPPLSGKLKLSPENLLVWPDSAGNVRGISLEPLYPTAVFAAKQDALLYELLALVDSVRSGSAREVNLATQGLQRRLLRGDS